MPSNAQALAAELRAIAERAAGPGGQAAAAAMALEGERAIKTKLSTYSHGKGTPTPSPPGQPPAIVTGTLRRSVITQPPLGGGGRWVATVGPTVVYARIQELGGDTGRNHATHLPARPYVHPAIEQLRVSGQLNTVAAAAFRRIVFGG